MLTSLRLRLLLPAARKGKGVCHGVTRASNVVEIIGHVCQIGQLALLSVRVAVLLSEEAGDQPFCGQSATEIANP